MRKQKQWFVDRARQGARSGRAYAAIWFNSRQSDRTRAAYEANVDPASGRRKRNLAVQSRLAVSSNNGCCDLMHA